MNTWKRLLLVITGLLAVAFLLSLTSTPPAHSQAARAATRVEVVNTPLPVAAMNDALNEPYAEFREAHIEPGARAARLAFDVPDGKRLVIETVTVQFGLASDEPGVAELLTEVNGRVTGLRFLTLQPQGGGLLQGTFPITIRVDGTPAADEVQVGFIRRTPSPNGLDTVGASVDGYLVSH